MNNESYNGRLEAVGVGFETTPGVAVAPQVFLPWNTLGLQPRTNVVEDQAAYGVPDAVADSAVTHRWVEGTVDGPLGLIGIGFLLKALYGTCTTTGTTPNFTHTFTNKISAVPTTLTAALVSPNSSQRHSYTVVDNVEISAETGGPVNFSAPMKARAGVTSSETVAHNHSEKQFYANHVKLQVAPLATGLAASTPIAARSVTAILERGTEPYVPLGTQTDIEFNKLPSRARGTFTARLTTTQYETDFLGNVANALRITIEDGTESLVLTGTRVRYRELEKGRERDGVVTVTVQFFAEFDPTTNAAMVPVVKNSRATYVPA